MPNVSSPTAGTHARFQDTHWSLVLRAGGATSPAANAALEQLCRTYWLPLYAFARRQGHSVADAQDVTQEFLAELIARRVLAGVDPRHGKFRSYLLACLTHFLAKDWRARKALKRGGGRADIPLDVALAEKRLAADGGSTASPERLYDQRWAMTVMEQALAQLQQEMVRARKESLFTELKRYLTHPPSDGAYDAVAVTLKMSPTAVGMAVMRLRKRYRELVRAILAKTVSTPAELDEELRYLLEVFS